MSNRDLKPIFLFQLNEIFSVYTEEKKMIKARNISRPIKLYTKVPLILVQFKIKNQLLCAIIKFCIFFFVEYKISCKYYG